MIDIDLGQNWSFEAEYRMDGNVSGSLNTLFSYGDYTDGILLRTLRGDGFYLKGNNAGSPNLFANHSNDGNGTNTNNEFVPVRITYAASNSGGTLEVFVDDVLNFTHNRTDLGALNPSTKQIWIGSAHHRPVEGFDGAVRNITITSENITQRPIATSVEVTGGSFDASQLPTELSDNDYAQLLEMLVLSAVEPIHAVSADPTAGSDFSWTFTSGESGITAIDYLSSGETLELTYSIQSTDSSTERGGQNSDTATTHVVITITGANNRPVISGSSSSSVQEDVTISTSGTLVATDSDAGATQNWEIQGDANGVYGSLALNGNSGEWTYTLNNGSDGTASIVQNLAENQTVQDQFTVRVTDDQGAFRDQLVTLTITGATTNRSSPSRQVKTAAPPKKTAPHRQRHPQRDRHRSKQHGRLGHSRQCHGHLRQLGAERQLRRMDLHPEQQHRR